VDALVHIDVVTEFVVENIKEVVVVVLGIEDPAVPKPDPEYDGTVVTTGAP
jgi:hypothetical protein